jgi:hypothetical protein
MITLGVLSITPGTRHVGYAYFEGNELIEWGVKENTKGSIKDRVGDHGRLIVSELVKRHEPRVVVLPKPEPSHNRANQQRFIETLKVLFASGAVVVRYRSARDVRACFQTFDATVKPTKHAIMVRIGRLFPELEPLVPNPRRPWDPQDYWTPMFDAVARGVAWLAAVDGFEKVPKQR